MLRYGTTMARVPSALIVVENMSVPADPRVWPECTSLAAGGWDVTVIAPQGTTSDLDEVEVVAGIEIHRYPPRPSSGGLRGYSVEYAHALRCTRRLARSLAPSRRFDVAQFCNPPDVMALALLELRRRGVAMVFDHHDLVPELFQTRFGSNGIVGRATLAAERLSFRLADVVVSANESFREVALERGRKLPEDVFVVRNGPSSSVFKPLAPDPDLKRRPFLIGYAGVIGPQDGVDTALEALATLRRQRDDWTAVFAGAGDAFDEARRQCMALGLEDVVDLIGFVDDRDTLVRLLSTCDVCLSPEPRNALNEHSTLIKVAEYMAVGRPVVAFDLEETRRTAGEAAIYAGGDDAESLAAAIGALLDAPDRRVTMGEVGRRRVEESLSWKHSEEALLAAYRRALGHPAAGKRRKR